MYGDLEAGVVRRSRNPRAEIRAEGRKITSGLLQVPGIWEDVIDEDIAKLPSAPVPASKLAAAVGRLVSTRGDKYT